MRPLAGVLGAALLSALRFFAQPAPPSRTIPWVAWIKLLCRGLSCPSTCTREWESEVSVDMVSLTWLDYSEQERRQAMEVIDLFREEETRDELGLGTIRDAFADLLFPGTSTIQTRAR